MFKRLLALAISAVIFVESGFFCAAFSASRLDEKRRALIVYDEKGYYGSATDMTISLEGLLSHFGVNSSKKLQSEYKPGECEGYDFIFVVGIRGRIDNSRLIEDIKSTQKTVVWLGKGVEAVLSGNGRLSVRYSGIRTDFTQVLYTGERDETGLPAGMKRFDIGMKREFAILEPSANSRIYSYIDDGQRLFPFVLKDGNLWHVSRFENNGMLFYIVADVLHDILGVEPSGEDSGTYIRIEDVHPLRNPEKLKRIADFLHGRGIPFMIALIPVYKGPESKDAVTIGEMPEFAKAIRYMQERGGSVVLHGYTHQGFETETSGEGFEFWNGIEDAPIDMDMESYVGERVAKGIKSCVENGIYPIGFEAPHYAMDSRGYNQIKRHFSTYVGQLQESDKRFSTTEYPYAIYDTELVNMLLPENLGYVDDDDPLYAERIMERYDRVTTVRGSMTGLFFHPYLDIAKLENIVDRLEERGARFYDMKKGSHQVCCCGITIESRGGQVSVGGVKSEKPGCKNGQYQLKAADTVKNRISSINDFFIIVISVFCLLFVAIFVLSRKRGRKNMFRH